MKRELIKIGLVSTGIYFGIVMFFSCLGSISSTTTGKVITTIKTLDFEKVITMLPNPQELTDKDDLKIRMSRYENDRVIPMAH